MQQMMPQDAGDLIAVRGGEGFDAARLARFLRGRLAGAEQPLRVQQFAGGAANLTYQLNFGDAQPYVLRRPPLGPVAPSAHDMAREYKVLSVLHRAFGYAPRAHLYCADENVIGAPFIIMQRCAGTVVRRRMSADFAKLPNAGRRMSAAVVDVLVEFHAVDYSALGLDDLGKPPGFIERQVAGWRRRWERAKLNDSRQVAAVHDWLGANLPPAGDAALVHNDYKLDNTMFAADDPGRLVAVLDWDMCTLGDPLSDLGTLLTYWTQPDDPPHVKQLATMPGAEGGFLTRRQLIERYAQQSGRDLADIRFYHVLGLLRLLVILQQIYIRYVRGQTQDRRFAHLDEAVELLAKTALQVSRGEFA